MKLLFPIFCAAVLGTGCSPFSDTGDPFASGRDGRYYNPQTGRYEWDNSAPKPRRPNRAPQVSAALQQAEENRTPTDGRVYNMQSGRYEWSDTGIPKTSPYSNE